MSNSLFTKAMSDKTTTWNGAESLSTPDNSGICDGRLSLFFKSVRGINVPSLYTYLSKSLNEDIIDTFLMSFHIRDCRGGKGERDLGRRCLIWLLINKPDLFEKIMNLIHLLENSYTKHSCDNLVKMFEENIKLAKPGKAGFEDLDNLEMTLILVHM